MMKFVKLFISIACGTALFSLFLWKGLWVVLGWFLAALISVVVTAAVYEKLTLIQNGESGDKQ